MLSIDLYADPPQFPLVNSDESVLVVAQPGPEGPEGPAGADGTLDPEQFDQIVVDVTAEIQPTLDTKADADDVTASLALKVDKVAGKGLTTNDFDDAAEAKLAGIEAGAEANDVHNWGDLPGKPSTFPPSAHTHAEGEITGLTANITSLDSRLDSVESTLPNKSDVGHTHAYSSLTSIPSTFAPSAHTHTSSEVTDFTTASQAANDSRFDTVEAEVDALQIAPPAHIHAQSDVTGLTSDLALKAPISSPTFTTGITTPLIKMTGGSPGAGKVLTSDADGDATWVAPAGGLPNWMPPSGQWGLVVPYANVSSAVALNTVYAIPIYVPSTVTIDRLSVQAQSSVGAATARLGIYSDNGSFKPGNLLLDGGSIATPAFNNYDITISQVLTGGNIYWFSSCNQGAAQVYAGANSTALRDFGRCIFQQIVHATSSTNIFTDGIGFNVGYLSGTTTTGALPASFGTTTRSALPPVMGFRVA